jgi:hypothetical protein
MDATAWTPGPWTVERTAKPPEKWLIIGPRGQSIGLAFDRPNIRGWNNARLMETAPALFAGLDGVLAILSELEVEGVQLSPGQIERLRLAEAALSRAAGDD